MSDQPPVMFPGATPAPALSGNGGAPVVFPGATPAPQVPALPSGPGTDWGAVAQREAGIGAGGVMYGLTTPFDLPGETYDLAAHRLNQFAGTSLPMVSTPGQRWQQALGLPQPEGAGEQLLSSAIQVPTSLIYGPLGKAAVAGRYADAIRMAGKGAAIGTVQGAENIAGLPPELQIATGLGMDRLAAGAGTQASPTDLDKAAFLRNEKVPVNPVDLAGPAANLTTRWPLSGIGGFNTDQFNRFGNAVVRRFMGPDGQAVDGTVPDSLINQGYNRIDGLYGQLRQAAPTPSTSFAPQMLGILQTANAQDPHIAVKLGNDFNNVLLKAQSGSLSADDMTDALRSNSVISKGAVASQGKAIDAAPYYQQARDTLRNAFNSVLTPDQQNIYADANNSYRSLKSIEKARDPTTQIVSPDALTRVVNNSRYEDYDSDLAQLAQAGSRFVTMPQRTRPVGAEGGSGFMSNLKDVGIAGLGFKEASEGLQAMGVPPWVAAPAAGIGGTVGGLYNRYLRTGALASPPPAPSQLTTGTLISPGLYAGPLRNFAPPTAPGALGALNWGPESAQQYGP